jgi:nitrile hydratase beta subunit
MDGIHDLGGKHGYGEVSKDAVAGTDAADMGPVFHHRWEAAVFAMVNAGAQAGAWTNTDRFRHAVERIDPVAYLSHGYYGRWLGGVETLLVEAGVITTAELETRLAARLTEQTGQVVTSSNEHVAARPASQPEPQGPAPQGQGSQRAVAAAPRFGVGAEVLTARTVSAGHTRLPAYARGRQGRITALHGGWIFPDTNAHGGGECPQQLYTVTFSAAELWAGGDPHFDVSLDLFEPYLRAADSSPAQQQKASA